MKTEVYSWRVSPDLKSNLEREGRRRKLSVSAILDLAAHEFLQKNSSSNQDDDQQRRLHQAASKCLGTITGGDPHRSERVRQSVRERLRRKHVR